MSMTPPDQQGEKKMEPTKMSFHSAGEIGERLREAARHAPNSGLMRVAADAIEQFAEDAVRLSAENVALIKEVSAISRESVERSTLLAGIEAEVIASRDIVRRCEAESAAPKAVVEKIWQSCKVIYFPPDGNYPIEHVAVVKPNREAIEAALSAQPKEQE